MRPHTSGFSVLLIAISTAASFCGTQAVGTDQCALSIELAIIQDATTYNGPYISNIIKNLGDLQERLVADNLSTVKFSVSSFRDKPFRELGEDGSRLGVKDYCYKQHSTFTSSVQDALKGLNDIWVTGGYDYQQAQLEGLLRTTLNPSLGWSSPDKDFDEEGRRIVRLAILSTHSAPHEAGDLRKELEESKGKESPLKRTPTPSSLSHENTEALSADPNVMCLEEDYPTRQQVRDSLLIRGIRPAIITVPATYWECKDYSPWAEDEEKPELRNKCPQTHYWRRALETKNDDYMDEFKAPTLLYREFLEELEVNGFFHLSTSQMDDFSTFVLDIVEQIRKDLKCPLPTTTTTTATITAQ